MIKLVCFDLDGVFFEKVHQNLIKNLSDFFGISDEIFLKEVLFEKAAKEGGYNDVKLGIKAFDEYWTWLGKNLGVDLTLKDQFLEVLQRGYKINTKATDLIDKLHDQNIKTAICSNNYKANIDLLKRKFELDNYFDIQVYSYEIGIMKPDKRIFEELVRRSNIKPEEIIFSDDREDKLSGANSIGINTFVYRDFGGFVSNLRRSGLMI